MEFFAFIGNFMESILGKVELFNNVCSFISYHNRIGENRQTLKRKLDALCSVEDDIYRTLEVSEFHSGMKRRREVGNWLSSVQRKKDDVQGLDKQIRDRKYSLGPWWETRLEKSIYEVEDLHQQGMFDSLLLDVNENKGNKLLTTALVGQNSNGGVLERIWTCLKDDEMQKIGVYGVEGIGKTAIMMQIHNQILENAAFDHVYWITVSDDFSIHKLQSDIAKEVGVDLFHEEDTRKRAARLHKVLLRRKKYVLILDGLLSYFDEHEVGIPTQENGCKLVITTRTRKLCRRMDCQEDIEIEALPAREAEQLFRQKIGHKDLNDPEIEEFLYRIVKECGGLPMKIIGIAESLRGVDDINEWRDMLNELTQ
ncbi:disease resistance protein RFL1-like [Euphorbia lathyris]|uniref:disease resistance protein RFL1-like n=1 Tax=Euphorbia lathyris TaxID=212925 RepID=UPI0033131CED